MTAEKRERRGHFRGKPRPGRRVDVEYRVGDAAAVAAHTMNIGVGGAFIVTPEPAAAGTIIQLAIKVPSASSPVTVRAEVRWTARSDDLTGMGVKFYGLDVEELLQLSEYFASLTGAAEAE